MTASRTKNFQGEKMPTSTQAVQWAAELQLQEAFLYYWESFWCFVELGYQLDESIVESSVIILIS